MLSREQIDIGATYGGCDFSSDLYETAQQLAEWLHEMYSEARPESDDKHDCQCSYCARIRAIRTWLEGES